MNQKYLFERYSNLIKLLERQIKSLERLKKNLTLDNTIEKKGKKEKEEKLIKLLEQLIKSFERLIKNWTLDNAIEEKEENANAKNNETIEISEEKIKNNETTGISGELAICNFYKLDYPKHLQIRSSKRISNQIKTCIQKFSKEHPEIKFIKHLGAKNEKSDFELEDKKVLSLKTNIKIKNKMCPQDIGQISRNKFDKVFKLYPNQNDLDRKKFIISDTLNIINKYWEKLWCCNFLLWIYKENYKWEYKFFDETMIHKSPFKDHTKFKFTQTAESWNEGATLKYDNISIGEFQFHKNRDNVKFRFILANVLNLINK